jgi:hypothetical protein
MARLRRVEFFFDHHLGRPLAEGMKAFGEHVEHLTDTFPPGAPDTEWLPYVGDRGLIVVTRDEAMRFHPLEKQAIRRHSLGVFFLGGKNRSSCETGRA